MKPQEKILFVIIMLFRKTVPINGIKMTFYYVNQIVDMLENCGYSRKQLLYYLSKWEKKGFYEYGVGLEYGWLKEKDIPQAYLDLMSF